MHHCDGGADPVRQPPPASNPGRDTLNRPGMPYEYLRRRVLARVVSGDRTFAVLS
jgi:hypothetical protein